MAFTDKTSRDTKTGYSPGLIPDFPRAPASLIDGTPGFDVFAKDTQKWWDTVKQSIYKIQSQTGIDLARNGASIRELATITEDLEGNIEGKYTLTVTAGDVVTGMEIISISGPDLTVSSVTFQADRFKIFSGSTNKTMFEADAGQDKVRMAGVLTVDGTNGALYIKSTAGAGAWNDPGTPFYVDDAGDFSLRDSLVWDDSLSLLSINGAAVFSNTGTNGNYIVIDSNGVAAGSNASTGILHIENDSGLPRVNFRYNGNVYGTWAIASTYSSSQWSDNGGNSVTIDGRGNPGVSIFGPAGSYGLSVTNDALIIGDLVATTFSGDGAAITNLNAANLATGVVAPNRLASGSALQVLRRNAANTALEFATFAGGGDLLAANNLSDLTNFATARSNIGLAIGTDVLAPTGSGASLTSLNASNISSGTLNNARLPSAISVSDITTSGSVVFNSGFFAIGSCIISSGALAVDGVVLADGSTGTPAMRFSSDTDTGWRWNSSGDMRGVTNGADRFVIRDGAIVCLAPLKLDNNYVGGAPAATGYVTIQDLGGTTYKVLVGT